MIFNRFVLKVIKYCQFLYEPSTTNHHPTSKGNALIIRHSESNYRVIISNTLNCPRRSRLLGHEEFTKSARDPFVQGNLFCD